MKDIAFIGLIVGLLFPVLGMAVLYFAWFHNTPVSSYVSLMQHDHSLCAKVLSLSLIGNLIPFFLFNRARRPLMMRGVLIATMLCAVFIVLVKFVW
jgi:Mg/Co/Ni transporter MgtE